MVFQRIANSGFTFSNATTFLIQLTHSQGNVVTRPWNIDPDIVIGISKGSEMLLQSSPTFFLCPSQGLLQGVRVVVTLLGFTVE